MATATIHPSAANEDWSTLVDAYENQLLVATPGAQPQRQVQVATPTASVVDNNNNNNKDSGCEWDEAPSFNASTSDEVEPTAAEASYMTKVLRENIINVKNDVEVQQKDPTSPLYSVKTFEELHLQKKLLDGVYNMGFNKPSKIQETALPMLLADPPNNMIAQSQSGTGKTAAFTLCILSRVDRTKKFPQALCLSPTYELALQTGAVMEKMGKFLIEDGLRIGYAIRGCRAPSRGVTSEDHIIIGTPGSVLDWIMRFKSFDPKKLAVFVLDEADVMISQQGHRDQSVRIKRSIAPSCQHLFFSATYNTEIMQFATTIVSDPIIIRLRREEESLSNIKQFYVNCESPEKKYEALCNIYGALTIGQTIIFCHTKKTVSWLAEKLAKDGHAVALLSGELEIEQRADILNRFRDGKEKVLITTNVAARGIDIDQVTIVVNYDLPIDHMAQPHYETYLHRIGRTGRFGKTGLAINFVDGRKTMALVEQISHHFGKPINKLEVDDLDELEKLNQN